MSVNGHNDSFKLALQKLPSSTRQIIEDRYSEPQRHYHTLNHLIDLFRLKERHAHLIKDHVCVDLAILFHDIVYDPRANDNEEQSAILFDSLASQLKSTIASSDDDDKNDVEFEELVQRVYHFILATKHHDISQFPKTLLEKDNEVESFVLMDLKIFLDMDMSILGREQEEYRLYASQVRQEYIHVEKEVYCSRRAAFLQGVVASDKNIYMTDIFHEELEDKARQNLQWEIKQLEQGCIP